MWFLSFSFDDDDEIVDIKVKTKKCKLCNEEKPITDFYKRHGRCKKCYYQKVTKEYLKDPERKKHFKEYGKKYYAENREQLLLKNKSYNKTEKAINDRKKRRSKYRKSEHYNNANKLRCKLIKWFKDGKDNFFMEDLVGCSLSKFRKHIIKRFKVGMDVFNHGDVWHIDHIVPCAKFDLTDIEQQKKCFNYTNLQPLYKEENWKKNKYY